jgi:hypothetical protein
MIIKKFILVLLDILIFTINKDEERKLRYIKRHNNENWTKSGIKSAEFWSRWLLWNLPTITASYHDIKKRFNIEFNLNYFILN